MQSSRLWKEKEVMKLICIFGGGLPTRILTKKWEAYSKLEVTDAGFQDPRWMEVAQDSV